MNMLRNTSLTLLLCLFLNFTYAQKSGAPVLKEAKPEKAGMSQERLQRLDGVLQQYVNQGQLPGAVALVARDGKIVYHKSFGYDDVATKSVLQRDDIFRIASQTKAITSVGVMLLFEEGKLLLDEPISKYIPSFKNPTVLENYNQKDTTYTTVPARREITIRHLLTHTSGISYASIGSKEAVAIYAKNKIPSGIGTPIGKLGPAIETLGKMPLVHQPGERFTYGLNTDVLGYLIEVVSGQPLDQFFRTRIFEPLGMKDTYFYLPSEKHNRLAHLYTEGRDKSIQLAPAQGGLAVAAYPAMAGTYFSGGAGLSSTVYDYAVFLQMLLNGGSYNGRQVLSPATVQLMTTNQIGELNQGANNKFGLGFSIITDKGVPRIGVSEGTYEWGGIFGTTYWVDPKEKIVAVLYTQKYPNTTADVNDKFRVMVYQALTELKASKK